MKKFLVGLFVSVLFVLPAVVIAETDYIALPKIVDIQKGVDNGNQIEVLRVQDSGTVDGRQIVVGGSATAGDLIQYGAVLQSAAAATTSTGTFPVVYTTAPKVVVSAVGNGGRTNALVVSSILTNKFVVTLSGDATNYDWIAIGPRP